MATFQSVLLVFSGLTSEVMVSFFYYPFIIINEKKDKINMNMINEKIRIIRIRLPQPDENWGSLRALVDVEFPDWGLEIYRFRVVQQENQRAWVSAPTEAYTRKNGEQGYAQIVKFLDPKAFKILQEQILSAYNLKIKEQVFSKK